MTELEFFKNMIELAGSGKKIDGTYRVDGDKLVQVRADDPDKIPFNDICPYESDCGECPYEDACASDYTCDNETMWGIPDIDHIVFSGPATIVFWEDGTKTVVKCMEGEKNERYAGFAAACMKKLFGSTSRAKSVMNYFTVEQPVKKNDVLPNQISMDEILNVAPAVDNVIQEAINEALAK